MKVQRSRLLKTAAGATHMARRAGIPQATRPTTSRSIPTPTHVSGSVGSTPNKLRAHESYARCRSYQAQPETNRETKANLSCALPDDIRHHAVKTHSRQQQRHHAEDSGESRQHALCFDRAIKFIDQSPWTRQRQLRIQ